MSFWSGLAQIGGAVGGFALGGPAGAAAGYGLAKGLTSADSAASQSSASPALTSAASTYGGYAGSDRNQYLNTLAGGQNALNTSTTAAINAGMPALNQNLQSQKESDIRRGISTGDLGTSFEGDITSAFQKNIANATAGQAMNLFNTQAQGYGNLNASDTSNYLNLLGGNADRQQSANNAQTSFWNSLIGAGGQAAGAYLGNR